MLRTILLAMSLFCPVSMANLQAWGAVKINLVTQPAIHDLSS